MSEKVYAPSNEDLDGAPHRILYEVNMLFWLSSQLQATAPGDARDAMLESFLLHLRNLRDFLTAQESRKDDILASHFFSRWNIARSGTALSYVAGQREELNWSVAHLTYRRVSEGKPLWEVSRAAKEISQEFARFLGELKKYAPEHFANFTKSDRWDDYLSHLPNYEPRTFPSAISTSSNLP